MACRLRKIRQDDLENIREWRMLPEITRYMYTDPKICAFKSLELCAPIRHVIVARNEIHNAHYEQ